jgi:predicted Zn-dependent protease
LLARALVLVLAILAIGWFAVAIRQTRNLEHAASVVNAASSLTPKQAAHVDSMLDNASWLYPGKTADILRGQVALLENQAYRAVRILTQVTRSEPNNLQAWVALAQAAIVHRGPVLDLAARRIASLDPGVK